MSLERIKHYIFFILVLFSVAKIASADLEITEINNPSVKANHCWIKVYNDSSNDVNITDWFVMDDDGIIPPQPWHYHKINASNPSELTIQPNSYAVIADSSASTISTFKEKNPNILGPLFYGSLTFKEEGTMGLSKDKKNIIGQKSYGTTETNLGNSEDTSNANSNGSIDSNTSSSSSSGQSEKVPTILRTTTKIISPKIVVARVPFNISSLTTTNTNKVYNVGNFVWNFGDGMVSKIGTSVPFEYTYEYPGEYVLTLSYYDSYFSKTPDAADRIIVKVIPSDIYISSIGNDLDPYIEIENKSTSEIILSNWIVTAGFHYFTFPEGTNLLPGKKIKLSPKITGFVGSDLSLITISNPSKEIVATYPVKTQRAQYGKVLQIKRDTQEDNLAIKNNLQNDSQTINLNSFDSNTENSSINIHNSIIYYLLVLFGVIIVGIASFLLVKKQKEPKDYVEKGISASDMTIIE